MFLLMSLQPKYYICVYLCIYIYFSIHLLMATLVAFISLLL